MSTIPEAVAVNNIPERPGGKYAVDSVSNLIGVRISGEPSSPAIIHRRAANGVGSSLRSEGSDEHTGSRKGPPAIGVQRCQTHTKSLLNRLTLVFQGTRMFKQWDQTQ